MKAELDATNEKENPHTTDSPGWRKNARLEEDEKRSDRKSRCPTGGYVVDTYKRRSEAVTRRVDIFQSCGRDSERAW